MKFNPNQIETPKQAKAYSISQRIMAKVDKVVEAIDRYDQSEHDFNKKKGSVLVDQVQIGRTGLYEEAVLSSDGVTLNRDGDATLFDGNVQFGGNMYGFPVGLDAKVTKFDSPEATKYTVRYTDDVAGPNTEIVEVDKQTGDWTLQKRWLGFIPAPIGA